MANATVCKTVIRGFDSPPSLKIAAVAELVYAGDLKSPARKGLWVQIPPAAPRWKRLLKIKARAYHQRKFA